MTTEHRSGAATATHDGHLHGRIPRTVRARRRMMGCLALVGGLGLIHGAHAAPAVLQGDDLPGQGDAGKDIVISSAFLQPIKDASTIADGYFTIQNRGRQTHLLTGIASAACGNIIARHTDQQPTDKTSSLFTHLALPHNSTLVFATGGYHFVCLGFHPDAGTETVPVTFSYLGGSRQDIAFKIAPPAPMP